MSGDRQLATFSLGEFFFGVEVRSVQEVIRFQEMTPVPLAASEVRGLINLRGQIVTAIDLRRRLRLPERAGDELPMNVVVNRDSEVISFLVDEIGDVIEVEQTCFESAPNTVPEAVRSLLGGVFKLDGRLLLVLDIERAVEIH